MIPEDKNPASRSQSNPDESDVKRRSAIAKRPFVEPSISQPIDVLEATTFFQAGGTGGIAGIKKPGD
jgi:hypothetical protein